LRNRVATRTAAVSLPRGSAQLATSSIVRRRVRCGRTSFPAIAGRPGSTAEYLAGKIIVPHPAMPGVALTADEIRDIVAYIVTLKRSD
jgi:hypothetical protein